MIIIILKLLFSFTNNLYSKLCCLIFKLQINKFANLKLTNIVEMTQQVSYHNGMFLLIANCNFKIFCLNDKYVFPIHKIFRLILYSCVEIPFFNPCFHRYWIILNTEYLPFCFELNKFFPIISKSVQK